MRCRIDGCAIGCRSACSGAARPGSCCGSGWAFRFWLFALAIGRVLGAITRRILGRIFSRTGIEWDEELLKRTSGSLTVLWAIIVAAALLPWLVLLPSANDQSSWSWWIWPW
jgi:hypothetical protein